MDSLFVRLQQRYHIYSKGESPHQKEASVNHMADQTADNADGKDVDAEDDAYKWYKWWCRWMQMQIQIMMQMMQIMEISFYYK